MNLIEQSRLLAQGHAALVAVQSFFPDAILAGGFLRDLFTAREPKDIDIFVNAASLVDIIEFEQTMSAVKQVSGDYITRGEVQSIWDVPGSDFPVQVIMLKNDFNVIDRAKHHDFGICQVWSDATRVYSTEAFKYDLANQTFTLDHCESKTEFDRSMRRWERLKEKFPGWQLRVRGDMELPE